MDTQIQIFTSPQFGAIRTCGTADHPLFCLMDVCNILGLRNSRDVKRRLSTRGVVITDVSQIVNSHGLDTGKTKSVGMTFINEANLYRCIFQSRKEEAEMFQDWVSEEVLPSIRKHGAYMTDATRDKVISDPSYLVALANDLQKEHEKRLELERKLEELKPQADYYTWLMGSESLLCATNIASEYDMQPAEFNSMLARFGVQKKNTAGGQWTLRDAYLNKGLTETATYWDKRTHKPRSSSLTKWTQRGHEFLYYFLKERGVIPVSERPKQLDLFDQLN